MQQENVLKNKLDFYLYPYVQEEIIQTFTYTLYVQVEVILTLAKFSYDCHYVIEVLFTFKQSQIEVLPTR